MKNYFKTRKHFVMLALSILCLITLSITAPMLLSIVRYTGINSQITEAENLAKQYRQQLNELEECSQAFRESIREMAEESEAHVKELKAEREKMAEEDAIIRWCFESSTNHFAAGVRDYICIGIGFAFLASIAGFIYAMYKTFTSLMNREGDDLMAEGEIEYQESQEREFDGKAFIETVQRIQDEIKHGNTFVDVAFAKIDEMYAKAMQEIEKV